MNNLLKLQLKPRITLSQLLLAAYGVGMCLTLWAMRSHYPILFLTLFCLIPLSSGAIVGNRLAASHNPKNCRRQINRMFLAIATMAAFILLFGQFNIYRLFPLIVRLYLGAYHQPIILALGCLTLGLVLSIELSGKRSRQQLHLLVGIVLGMMIPLGIILYYTFPMTGIASEPLVLEGVVLQTTSHTCVPASIATLARFVGLDPNLSERDVVKLTHTTQKGTHSLGTIQAMEQLGLAPSYQWGLTIDDLIATGKPAVLTVKEPVDGVIFNHAVALLSIDGKARTVTIGNPLYGRQILTFDQMKGYWIGQAIFVTYPPKV
ncbi:MAG: cysteine peptidase family C39 domain-containing protein [Coleofasciculus sp. G1-WW12-02]|uniref:cysteine peptidase family C39 domain-containing protein n=1 Tax=unclassified Coleofasciculus TaxID=2692782 RepID=UPI0033004C39